MAINEVQMQCIEQWLLGHDARGARAQFRSEFPGVSLTICAAIDVDDGAPYRHHPQFDIYLIDSRDHCVRLTTDIQHATGVLLAQHSGARP